jgi:hypothetical protein
MTATTLRNQISKVLMRLYTNPILETLKARIHAKITTGKPVAIANTKGKK